MKLFLIAKKDLQLTKCELADLNKLTPSDYKDWTGIAIATIPEVLRWSADMRKNMLREMNGKCSVAHQEHTGKGTLSFLFQRPSCAQAQSWQPLIAHLTLLHEMETALLGSEAA